MSSDQAQMSAGDRDPELLALRDPAYWLALRICGDREIAEDAVQEAYAQVLAGPADARAAGRLRPWFLSVVANRTRMILRSEKRRRAREAAAVKHESAAGHIEAADAETAAMIRGALGGLEEKYRLPVHLCMEQGMTRADAAAVLSVPERTVSQRVQGGLDRLRRALEQSGVSMSVAGIGGSLGAGSAIRASVPLTEAIRTMLAGGATAKASGAAAGATAAGAGTAFAAWKLIAAAGLAVAGIAGAFTFRFGGGEALPAVAPEDAAPRPPASFAAKLARTETIRLHRENPRYVVNNLVRRHRLDVALGRNVWGASFCPTEITLEHRGTLKECLRAVAGKSGLEVSFEDEIVRFWRKLPDEQFEKLKKDLASRDTQRRCVAAWRLGTGGDLRAGALLYEPCLDDEDDAVRFWARRSLATSWNKSLDFVPALPLPAGELDRAAWVRRALASGDEDLLLLGLAAAGCWREAGGQEDRLISLATIDRGDARTSALACWVLERCRYEKAGDALMEFLLHSRVSNWASYRQRRVVRAIEAFGRGGDLSRAMTKLLAGENPDGKILALQVLGEMRHEPSLPVMLKLAAPKNADADVRRAAVSALGSLRDPRAVETLERAAGQRSIAGWGAITALSGIEAPEARAALKRLAEGKRQGLGLPAAISSLVRLQGSAAEPWLLEMLKTGDVDTQSRVLRELARVGTAKSLPAVLKLADRPTRNRFGRPRTEAIACLATLGGKQALEVLSRAARSKEFFVKTRASRALGRLGTPEALAVLKKMLRDKRHSFEALGGLKVASYGKPELLGEMIASTEETKRRHLAHSLSSLASDPALADQLAKLLSAKDGKLRRLAVSGLGTRDAGPLALPVAMEMLKSQDREDRRTALGCIGRPLAKSVDPRCKSLVFELVLKEKDRMVLGAACRVLGSFKGDRRALKLLLARIGPENNSWVRSSAISALGKLEAREAVEPLIALLEEKPDKGKAPPMLMHIARALGRIGDGRATEPLLRHLGSAGRVHYSMVIMALRDLGDKRADATLLSELGKQARSMKAHGNRYGSVLHAILHIGTPETVEKTLAYLDDPDYRVRLLTARALRYSPASRSRADVRKALADYRRKHPGDSKKKLHRTAGPQPEPAREPEPPEVF